MRIMLHAPINIFAEKEGGRGWSHKLTLNYIFYPRFLSKALPQASKYFVRNPIHYCNFACAGVILFQKKLLGVTEAVKLYSSRHPTPPPPIPRENMIGALASTELGCHSSYYPRFPPLYPEFDYWHGWYVGCYLSLPTFILCPALQGL